METSDIKLSEVKITDILSEYGNNDLKAKKDIKSSKEKEKDWVPEKNSMI